VRFDRESYRKLYISESAEHRLMSLFARGLRDYLLRFATEDGTLIPKTTKPADDLCRVLGASGAERKHVGSAIDELLSVGYLSLTDGRLWVTRYVEAQEARSPGALRQQRYRDNHRDVTRDADSDVTNNVTSSRRDLADLPKPPSGVGAREARPRPQRSRRAPESWAPKPEHTSLGMQLGVVGDVFTAEVAKFRDHEFDTARSDWDAAFRNWLRRSLTLRRETISARQQPQNYIPSEQVPYHRILR
jgi:hypothetical protein